MKPREVMLAAIIRTGREVDADLLDGVVDGCSTRLDMLTRKAALADLAVDGIVAPVRSHAGAIIGWRLTDAAVAEAIRAVARTRGTSPPPVWMADAVRQHEATLAAERKPEGRP